MAIISEYQEDDQSSGSHSKTTSSSSSASQSQPSSFSAKFDPSNPTDFLEKVFDFVAKESDFLENDTAEKEIASAVSAAKAKKAKSVAEERAKAEKKLNEEKAAAEKKEKEVKAKEEKKKDKENDSIGKRIKRCFVRVTIAITLMECVLYSIFFFFLSHLKISKCFGGMVIDALKFIR